MNVRCNYCLGVAGRVVVVVVGRMMMRQGE